MATPKKKNLRKWAIQFPDGTLPGQYLYDTKKDAKQFAPVSIYGDGRESWLRAKNDGYKLYRVEILIVKEAK